MGEGEGPAFGLQDELPEQRGQHFWGHLHAGPGQGPAKTPAATSGFRDQVDARISPPADEYYIMKYEDAGPSMAVDIRDPKIRPL